MAEFEKIRKGSGEEVIKTTCYLCHGGCILLGHVRDGKVVFMEGDPDGPLNRGTICEKGNSAIQYIYHPNRIRYPYKRAGNRGEGKWKRISWETALDEVAQKLNDLKAQFGSETLSFSHGTYRTYHWDGKRFFNLFGSPNMTGANHICMCPTQAVDCATYGSFAHGDIMNTNLVVIWGHAPSNSVPVLEWGAVKAAAKRGAKLIVIDPRKTREAQMADLWLQIKPGTDVALMLGWLR